MKKILSILLCLILILGSVSVVSFSAATTLSLKQAIESYEAQTGEKVETNRYYFLMPDGTNGKRGTDEWFFPDEFAPSWYNDNANHAGIYWWDSGVADPESWPGYKMTKGDSDCVYYADIPNCVEAVIFNNYFDGGMDTEAPQYKDSCQTATVYTCGYEKDESLVYPEGLSSFDNMIFVIDPDMYGLSDISSLGKLWWGEWYYYYGNGCYGTEKDGNENNCIRDDHDHENLYINFDPKNTGWTDYEKIYCSITPEGCSSYYPSMSIPALCTDYDGDGIYTYDLNKSKIKLSKYTRYEVYFYTDNYKRTGYLMMQIGNIKDTIYSTGEYEPYDLNKKYPIIKWTNEIPIELRPLKSLKDELAKYDEEHSTTTPTYRYYFLMPNGENGKKGDINEEWSNSYYGKYAESWYNEHTNIAGVYWWDQNTLNPKSWPGYTIEKGDSECIFYADVPQTVDYLIFNNALDGGINSSFDIYYKDRQSSMVQCYADEEYTEYYPIGEKNFDNMIYVMNPSLNNENDLVVGPTQYGGDWYYYYGDGCYGETKDGNSSHCLRDDHNHGMKTICKDEFLSFCEITEDDPYLYTGPLYYHYEDGAEEPSWFFAKGDCAFSYDYYYYYGVFGDYLLYKSASFAPSQFAMYIYSYDEQKFYTLEDAWEKGFDGIEEVFSEYLVPQCTADIIGDADYDNVLSVMDATEIQRAQAGLTKLYDSLGSNHYYGDKIGCKNDFDHDGVRSVMDATAIQQRLALLS